ncbi:hypothetical protein PM082_010756 [Marasmius tenuissimus]|nr:hypothetical protein PM082_010756 [Marasmius tenuissimus]
MVLAPPLHWLSAVSIFLAFCVWINFSFKSPKLFLSATELLSPGWNRSESDFRGATFRENSVHVQLAQVTNRVSTVLEHELTVILPVNEINLPAISDTLSHFESPFLRQVLLLCPESIALQVEVSLKDLISSSRSFGNASYSIIPRRGTGGLTDAIFQAISTQSVSSSNWILISDEYGLGGIRPSYRQQLLRPSIDFPSGPRGMILASHKETCVYPSPSFQTASYLVPPFVIPVNLVRDLEVNPRTWLEFGEIVSKCFPGDFGGLVLPLLDAGAEEGGWCIFDASSNSSAGILAMTKEEVLGAATNNWSEDDAYGGAHSLTFVSIFSTLDELRLFAPVICSLRSKGNMVYSIIDSSYESLPDSILFNSCTFPYDTSLDVLSELDPTSTVLVSLAELDHRLEGATNIRIPRRDLLYCSWMSSLTEEEWRDWHRPQLTIGVITKDRPQSLTRLLTSVSNGVYFGDHIDLRIHLEQSVDYETKQVVNHRVVVSSYQ